MSTEADLAKGSGTAIGVSAAACSVVPGIGTAACAVGAAVAAALAAIGTALTASGRENFAVDPAEARAFIALGEISPALVGFTGLDNIRKPEEAAVLFRILNAKAGYAGIDITNADQVNAYISKPDPRQPLTDPAYLTPLRARFDAYQGDGHEWATRGVPPMVKTPEQARAALKVLRDDPTAARFAILSLHSANSESFRSNLRAVRDLAGEDGKDDPVLAPFVGDSSFTPTRRAADKPHGSPLRSLPQAAPGVPITAPSATPGASPGASVAPLITPGRVAAVVVGAVALGGFTYLLTRKG